MPDLPCPANLDEFLFERLRGLPSTARLVVVLDPGARLSLGPDLSLDRHRWGVTRYDGNDLAFRKQIQLDDRAIVWITVSPHPPGSTVDLSSLIDIFRRADQVFDLSLLGVLNVLIPGETFPADSVERFGALISPRLEEFLTAYQELKPHLRGAALDLHAIRALVLHCLQTDIPPHQFLFKQDTATLVLQHYATHLWSATWDETGRELLRQQAREASLLPLGDLLPWFQVPAEGLAQFLYLYRFLSQAHVPNVVNQVRGLRVLDFDPEGLEKGAGVVLSLWTRDLAWRNRVIQQVESTFDLGDIRRVAGLLDLSTPGRIADAITIAESPALLYCLGSQLLESAYHGGKLFQVLPEWSGSRPAALNGLKEDTPIQRAALAIATILDESSFIVSRLSSPPSPPSGLAQILDWYIEGQYFDLELAHSRALFALNRLPDETVRSAAQAVLESLREQARQYLDRADHCLAQQIAGNWSDYSNSPRLSTRVLVDFVRMARLRPTASACLWFIVFDGMRYDTWQRIIKPRLMQKFEIKREKAYLCPLPSWTKVARTALMSGHLPDSWLGYRKSFTSDQATLASIFFELDERGKEQKLRFYSRMESDRTARSFDRSKRFPYNILVFNISDDDLHKQNGHLGMVNQSIETSLSGILDFLDGLVKPDDTVIISSDHGFMELDSECGVLVRDDTRWQRYMEGGAHPIHYRYISGVDTPQDLPAEDVFSFEYRKMRDGKFTVAIGRRWFRREESPQTSRYDHGGISFAEMVVPGAVMQLITEKKIDITFDDLPKEIPVAEGAEARVSLWIKNKGNQPGEYELSYATNTDTLPQVLTGTLTPGTRQQVVVAIRSVMRQGKALTQTLKLALMYSGRTRPIKREIPITVQTRRDVVEISLGGLDDLDVK